MLTSWKWAMTSGFSEKLENHVFAVALHMKHHDFLRIHSMLRVSPAGIGMSRYDKLAANFLAMARLASMRLRLRTY